MEAPEPQKRRHRRQPSEAEVGEFVRKYGRKHGRSDPNDRKYDRKIEKLIQSMNPEELDRLMRDDEPSPAAIKQIAIAVVEHDGQFLIGQRPAGVALAGLWEFPGGKIEENETPEGAAVRECLEETGLHVRPSLRYPEQLQAYSHATVQLHFIGCEVVEQDRPPHAPFRWVPRAMLAEFEFPEGNRALLQHLLSSPGITRRAGET